MRLQRRGSSTRLTAHQTELLIRGIHDLFEPEPLLHVGSLTDAELATLCTADEQRDWGGFPGGAAAAWRAHRGELMSASDLPAGERPWGYWAYDCPGVPDDWCGRIRWLYDHHRITEAELRQLERDPMLRSDQSPEFYGSFDSVELARQYARTKNLHLQIRDFERAAAWHRFRHHDDLAERYEHRAAVCRELIAESTAA